jgi:hypothetical protein
LQIGNIPFKAKTSKIILTAIIQTWMNMAKRIFCDACGRELTNFEAIQLLGHDLCTDCCKKLVPVR